MGSKFHNVEAARREAQRRLPRAVFDYVDGGADDEVTMRRNSDDLRSVALRPRMATGISRPNLATSVLGQELAVPILMAPCGFARALHPDGEAGVARAAHRLGVISILSAASGTTMEEVAAGAPGARQWFQVYFIGGRTGAAQLVDRAETLGYSGLVVTVDTSAIGNRERDVVNHVPQPLRVDVRTALRHGPNMVRHPRWLSRFVRDGMPMNLANAKGMSINGQPLRPLDAAGMIATEPPSWADVAWLRSRWSGPLIVKGILTGDDARRALDAGADCVVVSNHGGRQLDGVESTIRVLSEIVDAVGSDAEVLFDSGIRRGGDIVKALSLGARAVLVGRPYLWGLACGGEQGVEDVLRLLRTELVRTMKLLGCGSVSDLDDSWIRTNF